MAIQSDGTYVEDLKDPIEVPLPGCDFLLVTLRVDMPKNYGLFSLFFDLPPNLVHSPEVRSKPSLVRYSKRAFLVPLTSSAARSPCAQSR